jgi:hypothetical protein
MSDDSPIKFKEEQKEEHPVDDVNEEDLTIANVHQKVRDFVKKLLPNAELITDFNGNMLYLIPMAGFSASRVYTEFESNRERLKIADWGLS